MSPDPLDAALSAIDSPISGGQPPLPPPPQVTPHDDPIGKALDQIGLSPISGYRQEWRDPRIPVEQRFGPFARAAARAGQTGEEFLPAAQEQLGVEPGRAAQNFGLESARTKQEGQAQTLGEKIGYNAIPFGSAVINYRRQKTYEEAVKKFNDGTASPGDLDYMAKFEREEEGKVKAQETVGGSLGHAALTAPALLGEAAVGGRVVGAIGKGLGIGQAAAATPVGAFGRRVGQQVLATPFTPSMFLEKGAENARLNPDETAFQAYAPPVALAAAQNAVLGTLQGKVGVRGLVPRLLTKGAVGAGEQAGVDVAGTGLDQVAKAATGYSLGLDTKWGTLGDLARGDTDKALRGALVQTLTFAAFAGMHDKAPPPRPGMKPTAAPAAREVADAAQAVVDAAPNPGAAARTLETVHERFTRLLAEDPANAWDTAKEMWKEEKDAATRDYMRVVGEKVVKPASERAAEAPKPAEAAPPEPARVAGHEPAVSAAPSSEPSPKPSTEPPAPAQPRLVDRLTPDQMQELGAAIGLRKGDLAAAKEQPYFQKLAEAAFGEKAPPAAPEAPPGPEVAPARVEPAPPPPEPQAAAPADVPPSPADAAGYTPAVSAAPSSEPSSNLPSAAERLRAAQARRGMVQAPRTAAPVTRVEPRPAEPADVAGHTGPAPEPLTADERFVLDQRRLGLSLAKIGKLDRWGEGGVSKEGVRKIELRAKAKEEGKAKDEVRTVAAEQADEAGRRYEVLRGKATAEGGEARTTADEVSVESRKILRNANERELATDPVFRAMDEEFRQLAAGIHESITMADLYKVDPRLAEMMTHVSESIAEARGVNPASVRRGLERSLEAHLKDRGSAPAGEAGRAAEPRPAEGEPEGGRAAGPAAGLPGVVTPARGGNARRNELKALAKRAKGEAGEGAINPVVKRFGGIDPADPVLQSVVGTKQDAIKTYGWPRTLFAEKGGGRGLDQMAKELHAEGYLNSPDPQRLADIITGKLPHDGADLTHTHDAAMDAHYAGQQAEARRQEADERAGSTDFDPASFGDGPLTAPDGRVDNRKLAGKLTQAELERQVAADAFHQIGPDGLPRGMGARSFDPNVPGQGGGVKDAVRAAYDAVRAAVIGVKRNIQELTGQAAPRTRALAEDAANALVEHGVSPEYAARAVPDLVDKVLPKTGVEKDDIALGKKYMAALYEERLRFKQQADFARADHLRHLADRELDPKKKAELIAASAEANNAGMQVKTLVGREEAEMGRESDFQATLADPEYKAFKDRWRRYVVPVIEALYRKAQGLEEKDQIESLTQLPGLPFNAKAIRAGDKVTDSTVLVGGAGANPRNTKLSRLGFSKQFTGAAEGYDIDPRAVIENSIVRAAGLATKAEMYRAFERNGVGVWREPGEAAGPGKEDWKLVKDANPPKNTQANERGQTNFYVHPDAYNETVRALNVERPFLTAPLGSITTKATLLALQEATSHAGNLATFLFKPGVTLHDVYESFRDTIRKDPAASARIVELARIGATKPGGFEGGVGGITGILTGGEGYRLDPTRVLSKYTSKFLDIMDQTMRLTADKAFTRLADRGALGDQNTTANRRDFINQLGLYHKRVQNDLVRLLRDTGIGPFATAATNYTMQGIRALTFNPGLRTQTYRQQLKLRAEMAARVLGVIAIAPVANFLATGRVDGDDNTPVGALYLGRDAAGKTRYLDLAALTGLSRGARSTGLLALAEGSRPAARATGGDIANRAGGDVTNAVIHAGAGPLVQAASTVAGGKTPSGFPVGERTRPGENVYLPRLQAAMLNLNPVVSAATGADRPAGVKKAESTEEHVVKTLGLGRFGPRYRQTPPGKPLPPPRR